MTTRKDKATSDNNVVSVEQEEAEKAAGILAEAAARETARGVNSDKSDEQRAQAATANITTASVLGLTDEEYEVVQAFGQILSDRIESAPTAIFVATAETFIAKRMPGEANQTALKADSIEIDALLFVEDKSIGGAIGSLKYTTPIEGAKQQVGKAQYRLTCSPGDPDCEKAMVRAIRWLAQMKSQDAFKTSLLPIYNALYAVQSGGAIYQAPDQTFTSADADLEALMG